MARSMPSTEHFATIANSSAKLLRYDIRSVTSGTEAMGEAIVHLEQGDLKVVGRGVSTDIIEASAKAYVDGLNKLASRNRASLVRPQAALS
jgi:2-isopropylmalate synthase